MGKENKKALHRKKLFQQLKNKLNKKSNLNTQKFTLKQDVRFTVKSTKTL